MKTCTLAKKTIPVAAAAAGLFLGLTMAPVSAAQNPAASSATGTTISQHAFSRRLVLHGVNFDSKTGHLDEGSKAVLDDAAEFLKSNPDTIVFVGEKSPAESNNASCGLSSAEARTIASYMKQRGVPEGNVTLCQDAGSFRVAAER
jgi:outer membrane protein OmpA-like peptidoglycan-associated protein